MLWFKFVSSFIGDLFGKVVNEWLEARRNKQAGRDAERLKQMEKIVEVKDAQAKAEKDRPRTRLHLAKRMRGGKF